MRNTIPKIRYMPASWNSAFAFSPSCPRRRASRDQKRNERTHFAAFPAPITRPLSAAADASAGMTKTRSPWRAQRILPGARLFLHFTIWSFQSITVIPTPQCQTNHDPSSNCGFHHGDTAARKMEVCLERSPDDAVFEYRSVEVKSRPVSLRVSVSPW